jgi:hypothetical protein
MGMMWIGGSRQKRKEDQFHNIEKASIKDVFELHVCEILK